ncbi:class I SAM-dependent methyltransferase [Labrys wisconsinensis]|uniref:Phosphoethanolamine N-methyltransferase n=1 Tax=Labrys wisconsinensis TaxID=425677 RepID=A0ABU0J4U8_9HYPH|nr:methyltransferase domain-containing protein [Labrys wisconsinensis]MDQ0468660.1 phosphoethanolamine N-methyltransferase [Labrys wisconsinensis]
MQYSEAFTKALQFMWGDGFLSPGGPEEVEDMLRGHDLSGCRVLDIGAGLGGVDALLVSRHGAAAVLGIDVEAPLIEAARSLIAERGLSDRVAFQLVEPGPLPFPDASFDVVFSKDAMVHIPDKAALYREVLRVLKPGGAFIAADWLWAEGAATSPVVQAWVSKGPLTFAFTTPAEAAAAMRDAGFAAVLVADRRHLLQASNRREVEALEGPARQRLADIVGEEMALARLASARGRQNALDAGELIPSHLRAMRPV